MSFKAYMDNIQAKTGHSPEDFKRLASEKGFFQHDQITPGVKATVLTDWLKKDFELGHGHAMAVYAMLKGKKE